MYNCWIEKKKLFPFNSASFELMNINSVWRRKNLSIEISWQSSILYRPLHFEYSRQNFQLDTRIQSAFLCPKICHTFDIDLRPVCNKYPIVCSAIFVWRHFGFHCVLIVFENGKTFPKVKLIVQSLFCDAIFSIHFFFLKICQSTKLTSHGVPSSSVKRQCSFVCYALRSQITSVTFKTKCHFDGGT